MQAEVLFDREEVLVIKETLERLDFEFSNDASDPDPLLSIEVENGKFLPTLSVSGRERSKRDMAWAINHLLDAFDTIGWNVYEVECECDIGELALHLCPVECEENNDQLAEVNYVGGVAHDE